MVVLGGGALCAVQAAHKWTTPPYFYTLLYGAPTGAPQHLLRPAAQTPCLSFLLLQYHLAFLPPSPLLSRSITPPSPPPPLPSMPFLPPHFTYHARFKNLSRVSYSGKDDLPLLGVVLHVHVHLLASWGVCVLCLWFVRCVREDAVS